MTSGLPIFAFQQLTGLSSINVGLIKGSNAYFNDYYGPNSSSSALFPIGCSGGIASFSDYYGPTTSTYGSFPAGISGSTGSYNYITGSTGSIAGLTGSTASFNYSTGGTANFNYIVGSTGIFTVGVTGATGSYTFLSATQLISAKGGITGTSASFTTLATTGNLTLGASSNIISNNTGGIEITAPYGNFTFLSGATDSNYWEVATSAGSGVFKIYNNTVAGGSEVATYNNVLDSGSGDMTITGIFTGATGNIAGVSGSTGSFVYLDGTTAVFTNLTTNNFTYGGVLTINELTLTEGLSGTTGSFSGQLGSNGYSGSTGSFSGNINSNGYSGTTGAFTGQVNSNGYSGTTGAFTGQVNSNGYSGTTGAFTGQVNSNGYSGTTGAFTGQVNSNGYSGTTGNFSGTVGVNGLTASTGTFMNILSTIGGITGNTGSFTSGVFSGNLSADGTYLYLPDSKSTTGSYFEAWSGGTTWLNFDTSSNAGIGSGGEGSNAWIAYANGSGNWFTNSSASDICYRNTVANLDFGTSSGNWDMQINTSGNVVIANALTVNGLINSNAGMSGTFLTLTQGLSGTTGTFSGTGTFGGIVNNLGYTGNTGSFTFGTFSNTVQLGNVTQSLNSYATSGIYLDTNGNHIFKSTATSSNYWETVTTAGSKVFYIYNATLGGGVQIGTYNNTLDTAAGNMYVLNQINSNGYSGTTGAFTSHVNSNGYSGTTGNFTSSVGIGTMSPSTSPFTQLVMSGNAPSSYLQAYNNGSYTFITMTIQGRYMYTVCTASSQPYLAIVDISNPASIGIISSLSLSSSTSVSASSVYVAGNYCYCGYGANSSSDYYVGIVNISNPYVPTLMGTYTSANNGRAPAIYVQGDYMYLAATYFDIVNIAYKASPVSVSLTTIASSYLAFNIYVQGQYAYVGAYITTPLAEILIYNVSNPASPSLVSTTATNFTSWAGAINGLVVQERYLYAIGTSQLEIYDVSDPASLTRSSITTGLGPLPCSVFVNGRTAYTNNTSASSPYGTVYIIDVSNVSSPSIISSFTNTTSGGGIQGMAMQTRYVFTSNNNSYIYSYDIGGAYIQSLESGQMESGGLTVRKNLDVYNDTEIRGGLIVACNSAFESNLAFEGILSGPTGTILGFTGSTGSFQTILGVTGIIQGYTGSTGSFQTILGATGIIQGITGSTASFQYILYEGINISSFIVVAMSSNSYTISLGATSQVETLVYNTSRLNNFSSSVLTYSTSTGRFTNASSYTLYLLVCYSFGVSQPNNGIGVYSWVTTGSAGTNGAHVGGSCVYSNDSNVYPVNSGSGIIGVASGDYVYVETLVLDDGATGGLSGGNFGYDVTSCTVRYISHA